MQGAAEGSYLHILKFEIVFFKSERPLYHGDVFVCGYQLFQKDMAHKLSECSVHHPNANAINHDVGWTAHLCDTCRVVYAC